MKVHRIAGGGGTELHVLETGNTRGRSILFIHGFSQCSLAWTRQLNSDLADEYRLLAMDLRGHGLSDKPREGYSDSKLWADDVNSVIQALGLDHPILSGWSYGPLVILDYIRHYGESAIGGANFIGGVTKLGSDAATAALTPEFLSLVPGFFSTNMEESVSSLRSLLRLCFAREVSTEEHCLMLGYNVTVPPYVREALLSRALDNDDLLPKLQKPVLITQGTADAVVRPITADQHKAAMAHAQLHLMPDTGHAPFWDDAAGFNRELRLFCRKAAGSSAP
jgi:pimeloyl-ACP methyl ester carboxylesterase